MPNQHTAAPVDPSLADTMVTNTMVTNLATLKARMGSKGMANMVPAGMDKDITSWASTYLPFEIIGGMEGRGAFVVRGYDLPMMSHVRWWDGQFTS